MKVGTTGRGQSELVREAREVSRRVERLLAAYDLDRGAARGTEIRRQRAQFRFRQAVLGRMREHGRAAGADDPAHHLRQGCPAIPDVADFSRTEVFPERRPHVFHDPGTNEVLGEMRAADRLAAGNLQDVVEHVGQPFRPESSRNESGTQVSRLLLPLCAAAQAWARRIDIEADNVHAVLA